MKRFLPTSRGFDDFYGLVNTGIDYYTHGRYGVPSIWPEGNIPAGSVNDELLTSLELFPSFASAAGAALPEDVPLDGYDWWSTVKGETKSPRIEMFWKRKNLIGARVGRWKWVDMGGKSGGLFDLAADIGEKNDLSAKRPEILKMVKDCYANWLAEMEAAEPRGPFRDY